MTIIVTFAYIWALVAANLSAWYFGPVAIPINAFFLIGFDLAARDWLHGKIRPAHMLWIILAGSAATCFANQAAYVIAIASAIAFLFSALADWATFRAVRGTWGTRAFVSNVVGAAVDSILFPLLAFGGLDLKIVAAMFMVKVAGASVWVVIISKLAAFHAADSKG